MKENSGYQLDSRHTVQNRWVDYAVGHSKIKHVFYTTMFWKNEHLSFLFISPGHRVLLFKYDIPKTMNSGTLLNGIEVNSVSFGLKPLIEFQSAFFNSITDLSSEGY